MEARILRNRAPRTAPPPYSATSAPGYPNGTRRFRAVPQKVRPHRSGAHLPLRVREGSRPPRILRDLPTQVSRLAGLDPNARPAARGRAEIPKRTTAHPELFENFLAVTQYFAINARAQRTRDQTIPGGSHMSYGSPRQNRHSLTAT
ncbi:hypothetical protein DID88_006781 [Monilinia fructigena]|uniref:Uncharacterized protein n=1 Tax=Monilinia fructigena TaxID=38457 RepID=A0A395ICC2_9HELO|nr:hypothetical protein DID88_006781 [Monilinia fructigena]